MEDEVFDASFYAAGGMATFTAPKGLEVPMDNTNEVVTVDLVDDIPDDPVDLTTFLTNENAEPKYWIAIAAGYANKGLVDESRQVITEGLERFKNQNHAAVFHTFMAWLYIRQARAAKTVSDRDAALLMASECTKSANGYNTTIPLNELAKAEIFYLEGKDSDALRSVDNLSGMGDYAYAPVYTSLVRGKVAFKRKRFNDSLKHFQAVLVEQPLIKPDPRIGIGLSFWALKDKKLAIKSWERALQIDPENEVAKLLLTLSKFDTSFNSVSDEEFTTNYLGALESLSKLLKTDEKNPISLLLLASYNYSKGEHDTVVRIAEKVLSSTFDSTVAFSDAHFWLGRVSFEKENYTDAQRHFKESTELNPSNLLSQLGHVQSLYKRNEIQDAIFTTEALVKKHEKVAEFQYVLGMLYTAKLETDAKLKDAKKEADDESKARHALQEYIKLAEKNNDPVVVTAYLTLSRFSENEDNLEALKFLSKAVESFKRYGDSAPSELLNNMGVFHFIQGNPESAQTFFKSAIDTNESEETGISLTYNLARSLEGSDEESAIAKYDSILDQTPGYTYANMRLLFLELIKGGRGEELDAKVDALLASDDSNLEVRAFYSWYLKKTGRGSHNGLENTHNKDTLTKYDSRDTYALISLANMYRTIAREMKPKNDQDQQKRKTSYHRAAQLFHKALSTDPKNAFAAQGIAIIFAEEKRQAQALEIFRRVRDSVDNYSVHVNLGHCLCELNQHSKAIQEYQIALGRFSDETKDSRTLSLIGRAWFSRGGSEKSLESFFKSLEFSLKALDVAEKNDTKKLIPSMKFNVAFVKFNIAQFVQKLDISKRTVDDIKKAIGGLNDAIDVFNILADDPSPPVQADMLRQRASMGSNTLKNQLERSLKEQEEYEIKFQSKIEEAKRIREVERAKAELEEKKRQEEQAKKEAQMKEEYERLQEQAKQWEADREQLLVVEDEEKKSKKKKKKNAIWTDEEASGEEGGEKPKKKKGKRSKRKPEANGDGDGEEKTPKKRKLTKVSGKVKSAEIVEDSDDDMDDFDESKLDEDDALEKAEARLSDAEANTDAGSGDDEDEDLF
jgi:RNA polymerase-associated protein CTR9